MFKTKALLLAARKKKKKKKKKKIGKPHGKEKKGK